MTLRVDTVALGPVAVGARTFTRRGVRRLVAIVKATCELVPDGAMRLLAPTPLRDSELALRIARSQVVIVSASHAPAHGGGVRVAVARGDAMLLDKRVEVPGGMPAGLGPLPAEAPVRRARLGSASQDAVLRAFDVALPDDFDDAWFMTVPADQCTSAPLAGGDLLVLVHLHPERATLRTHLPGGHAVALLQTERGARVPIRLKLDTLTVLPEAMRAELLWRGDIQVDDEALRNARVGGAHGRGETDFPDLAIVPSFAAIPRAPVLAGGAAVTPATAFDGAEAARPRRRDATMLLEPTSETAEPPRRARAGTMVLAPDAPPAAASTDDDEAAPETRVMPPVAALDDTHDGDAAVPSPRSLPFRGRRSDAAPPPARRAPLPGAPWSAHQARRAPRARGDESSTMVLEIEAPLPPTVPRDPPAIEAPPAAVAAPPPTTASSPPPASSDGPPSADDGRDPTNPWRQDPADEVAGPPAPAGRPTRQRVSFKSDLYRKFKK